MIPDNLNYNFPIPVENLTNGKYSDECCWGKYKAVLRYYRKKVLLSPWDKEPPHPEPDVIISVVVDIETKKQWVRVELKEVGE